MQNLNEPKLDSGLSVASTEKVDFGPITDPLNEGTVLIKMSSILSDPESFDLDLLFKGEPDGDLDNLSSSSSSSSTPQDASITTLLNRGSYYLDSLDRQNYLDTNFDALTSTDAEQKAEQRNDESDLGDELNSQAESSNPTAEPDSEYHSYMLWVTMGILINIMIVALYLMLMVSVTALPLALPIMLIGSAIIATVILATVLLIEWRFPKPQLQRVEDHPELEEKTLSLE